MSLSTVGILYALQEFLFGRKKTPAEMLRQHQRTITKAQRELDRERERLERQEKKLIADIKKSAKANQMVKSGISLVCQEWHECLIPSLA